MPKGQANASSFRWSVPRSGHGPATFPRFRADGSHSPILPDGCWLPRCMPRVCKDSGRAQRRRPPQWLATSLSSSRSTPKRPAALPAPTILNSAPRIGFPPLEDVLITGSFCGRGPTLTVQLQLVGRAFCWRPRSLSVEPAERRLAGSAGIPKRHGWRRCVHRAYRLRRRANRQQGATGRLGGGRDVERRVHLRQSNAAVAGCPCPVTSGTLLPKFEAPSPAAPI